MYKKLIIYLVAAITFAGCKNNAVRISGNISNPSDGEYIYLDELKADKLAPFDSVKITKTGAFDFNLKLNTPAFYLLRFNQNNFLTMLLAPGEKISLATEHDSLNYPDHLTGSAGTEKMVRYNRSLQRTISKMKSLTEIYQANETGPNLPAIIDSLDKMSHVYLNEINTYTKSYIDSNITSLVSLVALYQQVAPGVYVLDPSNDLEYFKKVDQSLTRLYPDYEPVTTLHEQVAMLESTIDKKEAGEAPEGSTMEVPEITLPTPAGDTVKLSSTRGHVVLVDFWASWCPPCRRENPNLVKAYDIYHKKGFQIFQVSLDKTKDAWMKGIEDDKLNRWIHVSDVQYWNSVVVPLYKIESIPTNYLLDREGKVIGKNLRGDKLLSKLAEVFGK